MSPALAKPRLLLALVVVFAFYVNSAVAAPRRAAESVTLANTRMSATFDARDAALTNLQTVHGSNLLGSQGLSVNASGPVQVTRRSDQLSFRWSGECGGGSLVASLPANASGLRMEVTSATGFDLALAQWALIAEFSKGSVQRVAGQVSSFSTDEPLLRLYTADRAGGSVALVLDPALPRGLTTTLTSGSRHSDWRVHLALPASETHCGLPQRLVWNIYPSDHAYPAFAAAPFQGASDSEIDSDAYRIATYATAAGVLGSFEEPGSAYPTLSTPKRSYGDAFDFFDPDCWPVVATLAYSGDPLLQREARTVLERSEAGMLPDGQLPHHFEKSQPVYLSIAQSKQTGPNLFWTLAAIDYASATGDAAWLHRHYPAMQRAVAWILEQQDPAVGLIHADGPLFIDVFRRSGFTLDTNTVALHLLANMAETADAEHDTKGAAHYRQTADSLGSAIFRTLWNGRDHFITERHRDGSTRDFVDTDGNFAAIAFGVPMSSGQRSALLSRLDRIPQLHPGGFGTWVSERRYEKAECYGGNDGDSDVTMARIWWFDQLARIQVGDHATFDRTLQTLRSDLVRETWLYERYDAAGKPAHNPYYHEYPEVLSMVLREQRYGIRLTPGSVHIEPFGPRRFRAEFGDIHISYAPDAVRIAVPGTGQRTYTVSGLLPNQTFRVTGKTIRSSADGSVQFTAPAGEPISVSLAGALP